MHTPDIRKMRRSQLIETIHELYANCDSLERQLEEANSSLRDRSLAIDESGSLAEAACRVNKVMLAADAAAAQYLDNIRMRQAEAEEKSREMLDSARRSCSEMEEETKQRCEDMIAAAKRETQAYWDEVYSRLHRYCKAGEVMDEMNVPFGEGLAI